MSFLIKFPITTYEAPYQHAERRNGKKNPIPSLKSVTMAAVAGARQKQNEFTLAEAQRHSLTSYYTTSPICCDLVPDRTVPFQSMRIQTQCPQ